MIYVFDSSSLIHLFRYYYLERFPTLWENFDNLATNGSIISVREVQKEIEGQEDRLSVWSKNRQDFFSFPTSDEFDFVSKIFEVKHFQSLIRKKEQYQGKPVADPFVIAKAYLIEGCVITQESSKPNAAKIPNVCTHFNIACVNIEKFMENESWTF